MENARSCRGGCVVRKKIGNSVSFCFFPSTAFFLLCLSRPDNEDKEDKEDKEAKERFLVRNVVEKIGEKVGTRAKLAIGSFLTEVGLVGRPFFRSRVKIGLTIRRKNSNIETLGLASRACLTVTGERFS